MNFATTPSSVPAATQRVDVRRAGPLSGLGRIGQPTTLSQDLTIAKTIARLMDSQFELAGIKFGLDSVIGLIPAVGDAVSFVIGMYPIHIVRKHKLGKLLAARMLANLGADFLVGVVPLVGDVADVAFKANLKNYELLERAAAKRGVRADDLLPPAA